MHTYVYIVIYTVYCIIVVFLNIGEKVFVARIAILNENKHVKFPPTHIPAFVSSSKKASAFTCFTLPQHNQLVIKRFSDKKYEILTCAIPDLYYWELFDKISFNCFQSTVIFSLVSDREGFYALFYGKAEGQEKLDAKMSNSASMIGCGKITSDRHAKFNFANEECLCSFYTIHGGGIVQTSKFSVLCFHQVPKLSNFDLPAVRWVDVSDEQFPPNAFPVALALDGDKLYVVKGDNKKEGNSFITPATSSLGKLHYTSWPFYANPTDYECSILTVDDIHTVEWCAFLYEDKSSPPPPLAVPINCNWPHRMSCIGRKVMDDPSGDKKGNSLMKNTNLVGIIYTDTSIMNITWDIPIGEIPPCFDVLIARTTPKTLKQLCRNVILSNTLAIPHRIDHLSLPKFLKDYCKLTPEEKLTLPWYNY